MLERIKIQNYALIDSIEMEFDEGLTIITGETGAGKSILLGALGMIMGNRADTKVLFDNTKKCYVEATFRVQSYKEIKSIFKEHDLDYYDEMIIRREINTSGKSRSFVNDTPVTLAILKEITTYLVDLHQQFDTLDIHSASFQMKVIDTLAGNEKLLSEYSNEYANYKALNAKLVELKEASKAAAAESDFVRFQYQELSEANLLEDEQAEAEDQLKTLENAEDIVRINALVYGQLEENEPSLISMLQELSRELSSLSDLGGKYEEVYTRMESSIEEMRDIASECSSLSEAIEYDPGLQNELQERLNLIYRLQKKHSVEDVTSLIDIADSLGKKLTSFDNNDEEIRATEVKIKKVVQNLQKLAASLRAERSKISPKFEKDIKALLDSLSMPNAQVKVVMKELSDFKSTGLDEIEFQFASNKGSEFLPLKKVASGGEISRLTLSTKSLIASATSLPTMIYDEIDTGISGDVADKMGDLMLQLAKGHQVITITHSPQIASKADRHLFVFKEDTSTRTITSIKEIEGDIRVTEIAKMLSGNPPSEAAIANAKELMKV